MSGTLIIISAPSGTGKTSLVNALVKKAPHLLLSISYTTRPQRPGEVDGESYHFIDQKTFDAHVNEGAFLEHAQVFDHAYGTSKAWVLEQLAQDKDVILEIDWQGAQQIKQHLDCVSIFIIPPSYEALEERLKNRKQDSAETIAKRLAGARAEMLHYPEYDYLVINDDFNHALTDLAAIYHSTRCRTAHQATRHASWLQKLTDAD